MPKYLVFASKTAKPPQLAFMDRAKSGIWWRAFETEYQAQCLVAFLRGADIKAWYKLPGKVLLHSTVSRNRANRIAAEMAAQEERRAADDQKRRAGAALSRALRGS